jgi:chaperone BCS1
LHLATLANEFAETIPDYEFSTAELQGFLLSCKRKPEEAVLKAKLWVTQELVERQQKVAGRYTDERPQRVPLDTQPTAEDSLPNPNGAGFTGLEGITPTASTSPSISGIGPDSSGDPITPPTPPQTPSITPKEPKEGSIVAVLPSGG